jgi:YbbR domain-containing protein
LKLEAIAERVLPIAPRLEGDPLQGYEVTGIEVSPEKVKVRGPAPEVEKMAAVETEPIDLTGASGQKVRDVRLRMEGKPLSFTPERVRVAVTVNEKVVTKEFTNVEVKAKEFNGNYTVSPGHAYVRLTGPERILAELKLGREQIYLNLKEMRPGLYNVPLSFELPDNVKVVEQKPTYFRVKITDAKRS